MTHETPLIDIRPDHWRIVSDILQKNMPRNEVWAFGSRALWKAKEYSDLDLAIITDKPLSLDISASLSDDFSESDLPWKVDVVDWATTSESFRKIIERDKVVVQVGKGLGMASEWTPSTVGEFCPFIYGKALPERLRVPGAIPVMNSAGITGTHNESLVKSGGIVIGRKGTVGSVTLCKSAFWAIDTAFFVPEAPHRSLVFTYYLLKTLGLEHMNSDSAVPGLNRDNAHVRPISVPPIKEQRAIAHILGTLDEKIELNRRANETLESMARALFQSWFVDFDPVRAKLDGRQPAGLDAATAALFPGHFQDSSLGHIPKGWEVCSLADKIELLSGGTPKTSEPDYWDGDIPWYSVKDVPLETDVWVIHTEKHVTKLGIANSAAQILPEGTTIISARGTVGKLALIGTPMAMNQSCYGVRGIKGYGDLFTYYALRAATAQLQQRTHGTVFDTITRQTFETLDCIFPPANLSIAFDSAVTPLLAQIRANLHQTHTLAILRDTLLPKLLSGDLNVLRFNQDDKSVVPLLTT